jgi:hypothetical protein
MVVRLSNERQITSTYLISWGIASWMQSLDSETYNVDVPSTWGVGSWCQLLGVVSLDSETYDVD